MRSIINRPPILASRHKSEPKIGLVTKARLLLARRFARALCKIAKFSGTNAFAEHSKHDRSRLFEIAFVLVRFDHVAAAS